MAGCRGHGGRLGRGRPAEDVLDGQRLREGHVLPGGRGQDGESRRFRRRRRRGSRRPIACRRVGRDELEPDLAEAQDVARVHQPLGDQLLADAGAVVALEVDEAQAGAVGLEAGVEAGDALVVQDEAVAPDAANRDRLVRVQLGLEAAQHRAGDDEAEAR